MNRRLLALYPRPWRERYGPEVADLADELISAGETTPLRATLDLVAGAALERCRALARRSVLLPVATAILVAGGVLAALLGPAGTGATRPYFADHEIGGLLLVAESVWLPMELAEWWRGRRSRRLRSPEARRRQRRYGVVVAACVVAVTVAVNLTPAVVPGAGIRPGVVAFAAGMAILAAGLGLRGWSFLALRGRFHNFSVAISLDRPVVAAGPYRLLRHPGNAGMLLICAGIGLASANWADLVATTLPVLAVVVWRIRAEERALLATLGDPYRRYARGHRRLIPLVW